MQARMNHPAYVVPGAMDALQTLGKIVTETGVPQKTLELVHLRASQINGCAVCIMLHLQAARELGEVEERLFAVSAWREATYFSEAERAALALTEAATRLSDRSDPVPDEIWQQAASHYNEKELGALVLAIASINVWNRLNVTTRQIAGKEWVGGPGSSARS